MNIPFYVVSLNHGRPVEEEPFSDIYLSMRLASFTVASGWEPNGLSEIGGVMAQFT
ncbi:MAG: hypothetical protein WA996_23360 [Candidatus Promineifilaceae bacterium]